MDYNSNIALYTAEVPLSTSVGEFRLDLTARMREQKFLFHSNSAQGSEGTYGSKVPFMLRIDYTLRDHLNLQTGSTRKTKHIGLSLRAQSTVDEQVLDEIQQDFNTALCSLIDSHEINAEIITGESQ